MLIKNLLYVLQSENYNLPRFWRFVYTHLIWWKLEKRQKLKWTPKAIFLYSGTVSIILILLALSYFFWKSKGLILLFIILIPFLPVLLGLVVLLFTPLDFYLKGKLVKQAQSILLKTQITVIGITGSYGKTSAKEILTTILGEKYKVLKTPGNVNTDTGIANFIKTNASLIATADILIVEMGAYGPGEITKICKMVCPHYSILTGINETHIERFKTLDRIIKTKFELIENTKKMAFLNFDNENIKNNYLRFDKGHCIRVTAQEVSNIKILDEFKGIAFQYQGVNFQTQLLAEHNIILILLCARIAQELKMDLTQIRDAVKKIKPIIHRQQSVYNTNTDILVIDDSYNANFNGIKSGLKVLQRAKGRKVALTPGVVELGDMTKEVHNKIGILYTQNVDLALLIKTQGTDYMVEIFKQIGFKNYKIYQNTKEAHDDLGNILQKGDTIIFQNDLTDNYF
ncbi:UDP-N-acetylmuramoyl-tripeptide--D-alanyl-D-alanine ligase [Patescibacteria group bacterium]|nr:UDP-N-acetylmuramoyl-tripeptide--D-alanyl-D-alanine ligase [Patescibacteria group bacterium]MBU1246412.1 UDP-N-acetylmuramoyl-tripeptide--D-alanyl-D-alanine ligase [Patescibacteria group bacterium]MBU1519747.1 UDP-N-acetylmuramoyl-tripeptide--D-alanyl-D-alanine ligase [Patescibacteria group bacterium]MBU1730538.1 UDP-N-acetylmuramoyl-tripeptide--D-alanyl-D-alanine ligase [Patescibacteria group bacterium]MBU1956573.1 UDP-N-acetylmuramoyl-tripeptide--D-alanyl-D-alanine ligase [Patescibacteria 